MLINSNNVVKLIDFGLSELTDKEVQGIIGASGYYTYEMITGVLFRPSGVDTWNDGVCIYKILYGDYPFGRSSDKYEQNVKDLKWSISEKRHPSQELVDLLNHTLQPVEKRIQLSRILEHPWFKVDKIN